MTKSSSSLPSSNDSVRGFFYALSAYLLWGALPLYLKAVSYIPSLEVVAHRVIWSLPVAVILLALLGQLKEMLAILRQPKLLAMGLLTGLLVTSNWLIYVWAIEHDQTVASALGYYINPLLNVLLASLFLNERLNKAQWISIGFAAAAVVMLAISHGGLPWISLALPLTFSLYGFFRKSLPLAALQGFTLEILIVFAPAFIYLIMLVNKGQDHFIHGNWTDIGWLILAGPITAIPLILFAKGAKLLRYMTLGLMQYIAPTLMFLIAVFVFKEPFAKTDLGAFILIWIGLVIYSWSSFTQYRTTKQAEEAQPV